MTMSETLRRLNDEGLHIFQNYINQRKSNLKPLPVNSILFDERFSEEIDDIVFIENKIFNTRYDMGNYLKECFSDVNMQKYLGDAGLWSWIALYWFKTLCPKGKKPTAVHNYILSSNYNHRPRHAIFTTWLLVNKYGEKSQYLLSKAPHTRGHIIETLGGTQEIFGYEGVMHAAYKLYSDNEKSTFKTGATSRKKPGNVERFVKYLSQISLTYDLGTLNGETLLNMLPKEYSGFLEISRSNNKKQNSKKTNAQLEFKL